MTYYKPALRIAALYMAISMVWIALSDRVVGHLFSDPSVLTRIQTWKGWGFVAVTAVLLGWLVQREMERAARSQKALHAAHRKLDTTERQYQHMFAESALPMWVYDVSDYHTLAVNEAAIRHYGYSREEWLNLSLLDLRPTGRDELPQDPLLRILPDVQNKGIWRHAKKDGTVMEMEIASHELEFEGRQARMVIATDITDRRRAEEKIYHLAYFDALTGLPNRALLIERLQSAITAAKQGKRQVALLFFDLDRFKDINDSLGHDAGDRLLKEVARRLGGIVPNGGLVARVSADLYALLLSEGVDREQSRMVAEKALASLSGAIDLGSVCMVEVTACIGIALFPEDADDADTLMRNAEAALHHAIVNGRHRYAFYEMAMNVLTLERLALENELRNGLEREEFVLHYQPQLSLSGEVTGVEALVRWNHPTRGQIPPVRFISLAEESGLIIPLGSWVLREACRQAKQWLDQGISLTVAVNLSPIQFRQPRLVEHVSAVLDETGLPPDRLELEVTEGIFLNDTEDVAATLKMLRLMGVQISIDDFGTGYSSLGYLGRLSVNKLKIDQSFIRNLPGDPASAAITTTIITLAQNLRLTVIAEGVETQAQADFLREQACDEVQGYLYSKPLPAAEAETFIRSAQTD